MRSTFHLPTSAYPFLSTLMGDRRRNIGPDQSFPPVYESLDEPAEIRVRPTSDIRPICACHILICYLLPWFHHVSILVLQPGLINQANGSAYIETENTKIACSVFVLSPTIPSLLSILSKITVTDRDNPKARRTAKKVD